MARRWLLVLGMGVAAATAAIALLAPRLAAETAAQDSFQVESRLPTWVAPGGRLVVRGWAGAHEEISLFAGWRRLGVGKSGPLGRFRLEGRMPRPGRYPISIESAERYAELGDVLVRPLFLAAVGDVTFGSSVADAIARHGPRYPWLSVARVLRRADLATANLEGAVSRRGAPVPGKEFTFRGPPSALAAAGRFAGLDVVSLANNHSLDYGRTAFFDTIRTAMRTEVLPVGGGIDLAAARRPRIVPAGGLRIAFLGYSDVRPPGFDAGAGIAGAAPAFSELIAADVRRARRRADLVVVWFHWGEELARSPNARQRAFAADALSSGATVVLGSHPHVLQPVSRRGRRLVAWSLGNFVFPANSPGTERTGILLLRLDDHGVRGYSFRRARIAGVQPRLTMH
jgi:hypothetical protein